MAIKIERDGRVMYARISPPLKVTKWPSGSFTADVHLQLFLDRQQRMNDGVGRFEADADGVRQHIPAVIVSAVAMPNAEPTIADAYAAIAKLEGFSGATAA